MRATFFLSHRSVINYLSRQLRRQSAASAHQVLSGRLGGFLTNRAYNTNRADRNLCQFAGVSAHQGTGKGGKGVGAEELG